MSAIKEQKAHYWIVMGDCSVKLDNLKTGNIQKWGYFGLCKTTDKDIN